LNTFDYVKEILKESYYGLSIKGIFTAIFIENKDEKIIKYPFVHKDFDVNQFARDHFKVEDIAMPQEENQKYRWKKQ
jgi:hypothetical protein